VERKNTGGALPEKNMHRMGGFRVSGRNAGPSTVGRGDLLARDDKFLRYRNSYVFSESLCIQCLRWITLAGRSDSNKH